MAKELTVEDRLEDILVDKIDLVEFYNTMVSPLDKKYVKMAVNNITGLCPFHVDTDPSLRIWRGKSGKGKLRYHCFGCGYHGNVVNAYQNIRFKYYKEKLTKMEAINNLSRLFGIELPKIDQLPKQRSVFARMRSNLFDTEPVPQGTITLAEYRKTNKRLKSYDMGDKQKASSYNKIDIMMALQKINQDM